MTATSPTSPDQRPQEDRLEVTLGPAVGIHVFEDFSAVKKWLDQEKAFWSFIKEAQSQSYRERNQYLEKVWSLYESCFNDIASILNQLQTEENHAKQAEQQLQAEPPDSKRSELLQQVNFDRTKYQSLLSAAFKKHYEVAGVIPSNSPHARFLVTLSEQKGEITATFACAYLMNLSSPSNINCHLTGSIAAYHYQHGIVSPIPPLEESFSDFRVRWQKQFQESHDVLQDQLKQQCQLKTEMAAQFDKQKQEFAALIEKQQKDWDALRKTYDQSLAISAPVAYWKKKVFGHRCLSVIFGVVSLVATFGIGYFLYHLIQKLLQMPPGTPDPSKWHPEYTSIAALLASGVFGVWIIRILVRLFLSHIHLLADANERVTMANTYLALLRSEGGLKAKNRELILQALFRPAATGIVKDDGVPLSWLEALTKMGK